ncbi:MAG: hypothetical protein WA683_01450 [Pseudolabrys sp.]
MTARAFLLEVELGGIQLSVRLQIGSVITVIRQAQMSHWDFLRLAVPAPASSERIIVAALLVEHLFSLRVISLWKNDRQRGFLVGP